MATSRGQTPPVNLKERIAALQQRNVSPTLHQSAQAAPRGVPAAGAGGLRDKIAKFEEKGGVPVPRASFTPAPPQLTENAVPKKRGEPYGNRVPGLGRPSGPPVERSPSPQPSSDDSSGPRKRCISTGSALSAAPSSFPTEEPVPALPNGSSGAILRRNSLAINFGSGIRVMSAGDADGKSAEFAELLPPSSSSPLPEKLSEPNVPQPFSEEPTSLAATSLAAEAEAPPPSSQAEEQQSATTQTTKTVSETSEPPSAVAASPPPTTRSPKDQTPAKEEPKPSNSRPSPTSPIKDAPRTTLLTPIVKQNSIDGVSVYGSAPQSAVSQPSPSRPTPTPVFSAPSPKPAETLPSTPNPVPIEAVPVSPPRSTRTIKPILVTSPPRITAPDPKVPVQPSISSPDLATLPRSESKSTFKAVVHRKVADNPVAPAPPAAPAAPVEVPPPANLAPPATSQVTKQRRSANVNIHQAPPSPGGFGDLAVLLEDAAMLEWKLTDGDSTGLKADFLSATPTSATFQQDPRSSSVSTLTDHAPVPSTGSGSQSARSVSVPSIRESLIDGEIPEGDETDGRSLASTTFSQRSPSHRKYLDGIRRLTGRRSSGYMSGTYPRDSMSMSSEDSSPVATPSDNGKGKGFGIAWPSGSPKKSPNASRSSSFADKIFKRDRTRSAVSKTESTTSERLSLYEGSQPSLSLSFGSSELIPEPTRDGADPNVRPASWMSPPESVSEFSPTSSVLDRELFDAFPSVPHTLPPGPGSPGAGRASTLSVKGGRNPRLSMV